MSLKNFYELLDAIRERPALYIGKKSITVFYGYFYGFLEGAKLFTNKENATELTNFNNWVALRLGYFEGTSGWRRMLLESENNDEEKAFDKFFVFWDEYKKRQAKVIYQTKINSEKSKAVLAQIIKYTDDKGCFIRWIDKNNKPLKDEFYCYDLENAFFISECFGIELKKSDWEKL